MEHHPQSTSWHRAHQSTELQRIWSKNSLFVSMYLVMCTEHILVKLSGSMVWKFKLDEFGSDHVVYLCTNISLVWFGLLFLVWFGFVWFGFVAQNG